MTKPSGCWVLALSMSAAALFSSADARAEDVAKKFRLGAALGVSNTRGVIESNAANVLAVVDGDAVLIDIIPDPRNDSAAFDELALKTAPSATFSMDYALSSMFVIQASVGYQRIGVGDVEVQAQFSGQSIPTNRSFDFRRYGIDAGTLDRVPFQVTALARFRPKKSFNPYVGLGGGYTWVGFNPSDELDDLSNNMSRSAGGIAYIQSNFGAQSIDTTNVVAEPLAGAAVDAPSGFEWHIAGGFEVSFKKQWVVFTDLRYVLSSGSFRIQFDGEDSFGVAVPAGTDFGVGFGGEELRAGPVFIGDFGLVDGGQVVQRLVPGTVDQYEDVFEFVPDGVPDAGLYYAQGGSIKYDGLSVLVGVKYTF